MEWDYDAHWWFTHAQQIVNTGEWPAVGMRTGKGLYNPGLGLWGFGLLSYVAPDPISLNRFVHLLNIFAILGFLVLILKKVPKKETNIWLWGLALATVSPLAIIYARRLVPTDILPFFSVWVIAGHMYREKKWGAFIWGLGGALIGQVHLSGLYYAAGLFLFTLFYDFQNNRLNKTPWIFWILGSFVGSLGFIPWILFHIQHYHDFWASGDKGEFYKFKFYKKWLIDAWGIGSFYKMRSVFWDFLSLPRLFGQTTYLIGFLHLLTVGIGLVGLKAFVKKIRENWKHLRTRLFWKNLPLYQVYLWSFLGATGLIMTVSHINIKSYYLISMFPFIHIWLVSMIHSQKKLVVTSIIVQLLISASFLAFVHTYPNGGWDTRYGKTYHYQMKHMPDRFK